MKRNATVAVIGAGDFIGAAIAKKFAAEGFTVFAGRRNGDKLAPLVADVEAAGGKSSRAASMPRKEESHRVPARGRRACAARGLRFQHRRQRQFPLARHHRTGISESLGDGLLRGLPRRPGGGASDAAARTRLHLLHRRDRQPARRHRLRRFRRRQIRVARGGAKHGARTRPEKHPCRASDHRRRRRYRLCARAHQAARGRAGNGQSRTRD